MVNIINTTNQSHVSVSHAVMLMLLLSVFYLCLVSDVSRESSASAVDMVEGGGRQVLPTLRKPFHHSTLL